MTLIRKRYYFWLARAYIGRWKKTILASTVLGIIIFFLLFSFLSYHIFPFFEKRIEKIGYSGVYTFETVPQDILLDASFGLTKIDTNGNILPGAAEKWEIKEGGKRYVFHIKKGVLFHNKKELTATNISLKFKDVSKKIIDKYTLEYNLKNPYSPFLVSVSRPIFIDGFQGLGEYKLNKVELNGGFIKLLQFEKNNKETFRKIIFFYPTQYALKIAFTLGEVNIAHGVTDLSLKNTNISKWKNIKIDKSTDYNQLVSLFYNTADPNLSNKKVRQALQYSLPKEFKFGERAYSPISPNSMYFSKPPNFGVADIEIAQNLFSTVPEFNKSVEISTAEEFYTTAKSIAESWKNVGIKSKIKVVQEVPKNFQIFLYSFRVPRDPDQYTIWHSDQINNIMRYKNLRIDKLLEDGRALSEVSKRKSIYSDFQKYLTDDVPASFLYFPTAYRISK